MTRARGVRRRVGLAACGRCRFAGRADLHRGLLALLLVLGVGAGVAAGQPARWQQWPSSRPPRPLPEQEVQFPSFEMRTLANGLRVVSVPHHEQPAVSLRLIVQAGGAQDPAGKAGVAALVASVLDQGTTTRTAEQIADAIDSVGGGLGTGAGTDLSFVNVVVMKDSLGLALDLLADLVRHPAFAPHEIARQREQVLSGLKVSYDDPEYLAGVVIDRLVYGFHPYGVPSSGTPETVAALTREDLVEFHQAWFAPNNAILAVVGDVAPADAFAVVEKALGAWTRRDLPARRFPPPPDPTRRVVVVDRPGAVQTEIRIGNLAIPRRHPDHMALDLAIRILGGEGGNRLQRVLRSDRGLTYGASADTQSLKQSGGIVADTDTRSDATGEALRLAVDEIWRMQREPVDERELEDAKDYLTGNFPLTIETPDAIALQVLNALFYELDMKELRTFRERVNAVTVEDVQRVSRAYLRPSRLSIALVGDARTIAAQLRRVGFNEFEVVSSDALDLTAADFQRAKPAASPPQ